MNLGFWLYDYIWILYMNLHIIRSIVTYSHYKHMLYWYIGPLDASLEASLK
jgi:hypothetical protein